MTKSEYKAKIEQFCARSNYAQAKTVYDQVNALWAADCRALNEFIDAQGPHARHGNGLTADYVKAMPEYKSLSAKAYQTGEQCKTFNGVFTRVFKREHSASIQAARESRATDNAARWAALCATC
jgi:hypothetical protein